MMIITITALLYLLLSLIVIPIITSDKNNKTEYDITLKDMEYELMKLGLSITFVEFCLDLIIKTKKKDLNDNEKIGSRVLREIIVFEFTDGKSESEYEELYFKTKDECLKWQKLFKKANKNSFKKMSKNAMVSELIVRMSIQNALRNYKR